MRSTSYCKINGDKKLNKFQILIYVILNLIQNIFYNLLKKNFIIVHFDKKLKLNFFNKKNSISRNLCDLFWSKVDWDSIFKKLGLFYVHEIGIGDGLYSKKKINIPQQFLAKHYGYDINYNKKWILNKNKKIIYNTFDGSSFKATFLKNQNIFISQSCLEHIEFDLEYFFDLHKFSEDSNKKKIFIHCVPSPFCVFTYLGHGYRQYNINNINKIAKIFGKSNVLVCPLGNFKLNFEHLKKTTLPLILSNKNKLVTEKNSYYQNLKKKINTNINGKFIFSNFLVIIGFINFSDEEKKNVMTKNFNFIKT